MWSVQGWSPILTPSSVIGMRLKGVPVERDIAARLSSGFGTTALLPNWMGARCGRNPHKASFGVRGSDALQMELFRVSPTLWSRRSVSSGGKWYGKLAARERARAAIF